MFRLAEIRLIHWNTFGDLVMPVGQEHLIFGDNGCGKSTILDALQVVSVADGHKIRFNRRGNAASQRTLASYVRGDRGTDDSLGSDIPRYRRDGCSSYVFIRFEHDTHPARGFIAGAMMRITDQQLDVVQRQHFLLHAPHVALSNLPAVDERGHVTDVLLLRKQLLATYKRDLRLFEELTAYRDAFADTLNVPVRYLDMLVKSLDFQPMRSVTEFMTTYLLDERPITTENLLTNLDNYTRMEQLATDAKRRLAQLDAIIAQGDAVDRLEAERLATAYLGAKAFAEIAATEVESAEADSRVAQDLLAAAEDEKRTAKGAKEAFEQTRASIDRQLASESTQAHRDLLLNQRASAGKAVLDGEAATRTIEQTTALHAATAAMLADETLSGVRSAHVDDLPEHAALRLPTLPHAVRETAQVLRSGGSLPADRATLQLWRAFLATTLEDARHWQFSLSAQVRAATTKMSGLRGDLQASQSRQAALPEYVEVALALLQQGLRDAAYRPRLLCEVVEVADPQWREAAEAMLGETRYTILVAPEDFVRARELYHAHRDACPHPRTGRMVRLHSTPLVDVVKLQQHGRQAQPQSLAGKLRTSDPYAQRVLDDRVGNLICVDTRDALRQHARAVTPDVWSRASHADVRVNPDRYDPSRWVLGTGGWDGQQRALQERLRDAELQHAALRGHEMTVGRVVSTLQRAVERLGSQHADETSPRGLESGLATWDNLRAQVDSLPAARAQMIALDADLQRLEAPRDVQRLREERESIEIRWRENERRLTVAEGEVDEAHRTSGAARARLQAAYQALDHATAGISAALESLSASAAGEVVALSTALDARYQHDRSRGGRAGMPPIEQAKRLRVFYQEDYDRLGRERQTAQQELVRLKGLYRTVRDLPLDDVLQPGVTAYVAEAHDWRASRLADYEAGLASAREQAITQLGEDVIFKLLEHFRQMKTDVRYLNRVLEDRPFQGDRYEFVAEPLRSSRSRSVIGRRTLSPEAAKEAQARSDFFGVLEDFETTLKAAPDAAVNDHPALRAQLEGLFRELMERDGSVKATHTLRVLTDYRQYFIFDIRIKHPDGTVTSFNESGRAKSGGETQTPDYIALFAAMYQAAQGRGGVREPQCGLLFIDEAFDKLDDKRVQALLTYARELRLQPLIAQPARGVEPVLTAVAMSYHLQHNKATDVVTAQVFTKRQPPPLAVAS